jgi:rubrerythrin
MGISVGEIMVTKAEKRAMRESYRYGACEMLKQAMDDEGEGRRLYSTLADNLKLAGKKGAAKKVRKIAADETRHGVTVVRLFSQVCRPKSMKAATPKRKKKRCPKGVITRGPNKGKCRKR